MVHQDPGAAASGEFYQQVYALVRGVPRGRTVSYGQIARRLGSPRGARIVGRAMSCSPDDIPWQRVVKDDGSIAGGGYAALRRAMLEGEDVPFLADGRVDMQRSRWSWPE